MSIFNSIPDTALLISRKDPEQVLSSYSEYSFLLDGFPWPTAEHYYQAKKFDDEAYQHRIRESSSAAKAHKLGNAWFKRKRSDLKVVRVTLMTRAIYTKCKSYDSVAEALMETGDIYIAENSFTDYFWGCGRDGRGSNYFGKVLMNVRAKLVEEQNNQN